MCNPVVEVLRNGTYGNFLHPNAHLALFQMYPQAITARQLLVHNEFGQHVLDVWQAASLGVPTGKGF